MNAYAQFTTDARRRISFQQEQGSVDPYADKQWLYDKGQWKAHPVMQRSLWKEMELVFQRDQLIYDDSLPLPDYMWHHEMKIAVFIDSEESCRALKRIVDSRPIRQLRLL